MTVPTLAELDPGHLFGIDNLPYGKYVKNDSTTHLGVRIGDRALSLTDATAQLSPELATLFESRSFNRFMAAGPSIWRRVRGLVTTWLTDETYRPAVEPLLDDLDEISLKLPIDVADYVDFYASENHASNVGKIFRPGQPPLTPNWKHLPIGYHGRAGTVVVSGTEIRRPCGQAKPPEGDITFGPTKRLDIEAEVAFVVGGGSELGSRVLVSDFDEKVFGICLLNDWSARDIQAWEYVPLGPFLGKSFGTSVSAWITPLEALAGAWVAPPPRDPTPLPYLDDSASPRALNLSLRVSLNDNLIAEPPFSAMYWTGPQMLAHMTVNGAGLRTGDVFASGTVSGPQPDQFGSLLELSWGGTRPINLADGSSRTFLEDGDEVVITATAPGRDGGVIGLGEVRGRILPAADAVEPSE